MKLTTAQIKNVLDTLEQLGLYNESDKIYNSFKNDNNYSVEFHLNNLVEATRAEGNFRVANKIELAMVREANKLSKMILDKAFNVKKLSDLTDGQIRLYNYYLKNPKKLFNTGDSSIETNSSIKKFFDKSKMKLGLPLGAIALNNLLVKQYYPQKPETETIPTQEQKPATTPQQTTQTTQPTLNLSDVDLKNIPVPDIDALPKVEIFDPGDVSRFERNIPIGY